MSNSRLHHQCHSLPSLAQTTSLVSVCSHTRSPASKATEQSCSSNMASLMSNRAFSTQRPRVVSRRSTLVITNAAKGEAHCLPHHHWLLKDDFSIDSHNGPNPFAAYQPQ